jgi:hypothetical protein
VVIRVPHPEHPLVAAACPHALSHLVGQDLEGDLVISAGQRREEGGVPAVLAQGAAEAGDGLLESPGQKILETVVGDFAGGRHVGRVDEPELEKSIKQIRRPHTVVQVVACEAEGVQLFGGVQQVGCREPSREVGKRAVTHGGLRRCDGVNERVLGRVRG